ncbi:MAG: PIN domain-containing protein [Byssovorax sp.]
MTSYLIDTNVISETARRKPSAGVVRWLSGLSTLLIPSVGLYEIASGIQRLPSSDKRVFLESWLAELLASSCEVVPFDGDAALACAALEADARHRRRTIEQRDLMILATAKSRGLGVATRNVAHYQGSGVPRYNPFDDVHLL